ncbi:MAG: ammonium transporter [Magnetococcales bacterium]|nr:ammonium transporter [Magnetococcales bacterium]
MRTWITGLVGMVLLLPVCGWAEPAPAINLANTAWLLTATALVLFMTIPGLALFYGGLVRTTNVLSVLMHCFAITCLVSFLWLAYGYTLAFGDGGRVNSVIGGFGNLFLAQVGQESLVQDVPETLFLLFQLTFAIITPALVTGAFAERLKFSALLWFTVLWLTLVYIPVCHWIWGGGWLMTLGIKDFAGGLVVHITAGVSSLVAALVVGPRKGFPQTLMMPHNLTMAYTGAAMLWVGWFGFNGGSALAANGAASMAILVTHISAAAGSLVWMMMEWWRHGKPSVLGIITGMVAGLGTITPASGSSGPIGALLIGAMAGFVCYWATQIVKQRLRIDDSLDVFPVHGVGGILGSLLTAVVATPLLGGSGYGDGMAMMSQFGVQLLGVGAVVGWSAVASYLIFKAIDRLVGLRVTEEEEVDGLDLALHDERGYNIDPGTRW